MERKCGERVEAAVVVQEVHVVEHEDERFAARASAAPSRGRPLAQTESPDAASALKTERAMEPSAFSASATYEKRTTGSLSRWSSETQANVRGSRPAHWLSAVVFP